MFCMFNITAVLAFNVNRCVAVQLPAPFKKKMARLEISAPFILRYTQMPSHK